MGVRSALQRLLVPTREALLTMVDYLDSTEGRRALRQSHLEACLLDVVARSRRADGWSPLAVVGQRWLEHLAQLPEPEREALPRLRRLLDDSALFEWREEPNPAGGTVTYCRLESSAPP